jgi:hypothetical protein
LALLQFVIYGIISVPINFAWQRWMEAHYPGYPTALRRWFSSSSSASSSAREGAARDDRPVIIPIKDKPVASHVDPGTRNFLVKFALDQTAGSVMNITLFIVCINLLKGATGAAVAERVRRDFGSIMVARLKYRPVVAALMYTIVPLDRRVVFGSLCGVVWSIYLSLHSLSR